MPPSVTRRMTTSFRTWRLRSAQAALADAQHEFDYWVEPAHRRLGSVPPSLMASEERKLARLRERVARWLPTEEERKKTT